MIKQPLEHASWTVRPVGDLSFLPKIFPTDPVPASVPGCVHTALLAAGCIPDPYHGTNELTLKWIGQTDWEYRCTFDADAELFGHERIDLACDGLDTVATISLNGQVVGHSENMHVGYRFDLKPSLKQGQNELVITFASPTRYAYAMRDKLGQLPRANCPVPFNFIRKMACNFGWDWGPEVITSGIWRGIRVEGWSVARIAEFSASTLSISESFAVVRFRHRLECTRHDRDIASFWDIVDSDGKKAEFGPKDEQPASPSTDVMLTDIRIYRPERWWPVGYGRQPLYQCTLNLTHADPGTHADEEDLVVESIQFGLRTVELDTSPDAIGSKFTLKVNGQPIFCRGFNWIPDDCFLDRATDPARVRNRIQQAVDANANMLRVWGGGIYETDEFYDICDELGVLVWQDFLFACALYPEEPPIKNLVEQEVRYNVSRLSHHPGLVLWNGCNENLWGYRDWSDGEASNKRWQDYDNVDGRTWGKGYYLDLLPSILKELDPSRPYWAASPWSGDTNVDTGLHPNLDTHGNTHIWDVWNQKPASGYRKYKPRFNSEFGWQAPPTFATMVKGGMIDERNGMLTSVKHVPDTQDHAPLKWARQSEPLSDSATLVNPFETPVWKLHQKHPTGDKQNRERASDWFNLPGNFDDDVYLQQVAQARGLQLGVEWYRSLMPRCMGTLYWQLNDCWPVCSWAAIDSEGIPKPLWYATRKFFSPRLLTIQPDGEQFATRDDLWLHVINDCADQWTGTAHVRLVDFINGSLPAHEAFEIDCAPRSVQKVKLPGDRFHAPQNPTRTLLLADFDEHRATWFFDVDKHLHYPPVALTSSLSRAGETHRLTIIAKTLVRDLSIFIDRLDPASTINDQLVTLLPGESVTFEIRSKLTLTVEQLTSAPVLQCVNLFGWKG